MCYAHVEENKIIMEGFIFIAQLYNVWQIKVKLCPVKTQITKSSSKSKENFQKKERGQCSEISATNASLIGLTISGGNSQTNAYCNIRPNVPTQ